MRCVTVLILIFYSCLCKAQVIHGIVESVDGDRLSFANIYVLDSLDNIVKGSISSQNGSFKISLPIIGAKLGASYVGFQDAIVDINDDFNKADTLLVVLQNLNHYTTGNEESLGQILKKLPGLDVSESGQISFSGKRIEKILIDGDEFFTAQHKIALENISANSIAGVEVLQNYISEMQADVNSKMALNVKLHEQGKNKLNGKIELSGGIKDKYDINGSLLKLGNSFKFNLNSNLNNTGEEKFSITDYLLFSGQLESILENGRGASTLQIPKILTDSKLAYKGNSGLTTVNFMAENESKKLKSDGFVIFRLDNTFQKNINQIAINNISLISQENGNTIGNSLLLNSRTKLSISKKISSLLNIRVENSSSDKKLNRENLIDSVLNQQLTDAIVQNGTQGEIELNFNFEQSKKSNFNLLIENDFNTSSDNGAFNSNMPFLGRSTIIDDEHRINQFIDRKLNRFNSNLKNTYFLSTTTKLSNEIVYNILDYDINGQINSDAQTADSKIVTSGFVSRLEIPLNKIELKISLENLLRSKNNSSNFYTLPDIALGIDLSRQHKFNIRYNEQMSEINYRDLGVYDFLSSSNSLYRTTQLGDNPIRSRYFKADYQYLDIWNQIFGFLSINSKTCQNCTVTFLEDIYYLSLLGAKTTENRLIMSLRKKTNKIDLLLAFNLSQGERYYNGEVLNIQKAYTSNIKMTWSLSDLISYTFKGRYSKSEFDRINASEVTRENYEVANNISLESTKLLLNIEYKYQRIRLTNSSLNNNIFNLDLEYKFYQKWSIGLYSQNIFNINDFYLNTVSIINGIEQNVLLEQYPGYLMITLKRKF